MTVSNKLLESFKSEEFDTEFFIAEAVKSGRQQQVLGQLEQALQAVEGEMKSTVREASQIVIGVANTADSTIGELLSVREHVSVLKEALEKVNIEEQKRVETMKSKIIHLNKAVQLAQLLRKVSRISIELSKLRAQFPSGHKQGFGSEISPILSILQDEDFQTVADLGILKEDVAWARSFSNRNSQ